MVEQFWPHVGHLLDPALERGGGMTLQELRERLNQHSLLWIATSGRALLAACVTELCISHRGLVCIIVACGGSNVCWPEAIKVIEEWAKEEGCEAVRIIGRPGWQRVLPEYAPKWRVFEKELSDGPVWQQYVNAKRARDAAQ